MATSKVENPYFYIPDPTSGRPISLGDIYVGEPDLDPKVLANRKDINIIQEDGTVVPVLPASQPLNTGAGGVILFQGSPVQVQTEGNYSYRVDDSTGAQVFFAANLFEGIDEQAPLYQAANFYDNDVSSASNAYVVIPNNTPFPTDYIRGMVGIFRPSDNSSGASTLAIIGESGVLAIKNLVLNDGVTALPDGYLLTTNEYMWRYDEDLDVIRIIALQVDKASLAADVLEDIDNFPIGYVDNLGTEFVSVTTLRFVPGDARSLNNLKNISVSANITKLVDTAYAEGDGNGGTPAGQLPLSTGTMGAFRLVKENGDTGAGFDVNLDGSALLAAAQAIDSTYVDVFLDALILIDGSADLVDVFQDGDDFRHTDILTADFSSANVTVRATISLNVPTGVVLEAEVYVIGVSSLGGNMVKVDPLFVADAAPSTFNSVFRYGASPATSDGGAPTMVFTNTLGQIGARSTLASAALVITAFGWKFKRGESI